MKNLRLSSFLCGQLCFASGFEFTDFSSNAGLSLLRDAGRHKKELRLTGASPAQVGAAWFEARQPVQSGFETTFTFRLTSQDFEQGGADGLAFVVQNEGPQALGGIGASGGFMRSDQGAAGPQRGILSAVAVFFDTYKNDWDDSDNHVATCIHGPVPNPQWPPRCLGYSKKLPIKLKNGKPHTVRITYSPPVLFVFLDNLPEPVQTVSVDVARMVGGDGSAWVGFTASTGGAWENHDLLSWKFGAGPRPDVSSNMSLVSSTIAFKLGTCMPGRTLCTPEKAIVEEKAPGEYHVYLPAHLEWGASVPNPAMSPVRVHNVTGAICWDPRLRDSGGCNGPAGNGTIPGEEAEGAAGFVAPKSPTGSLVVRSLNGRVWFSINDRAGDGFKDNEGFFEFDVSVGQQ